MRLEGFLGRGGRRGAHLRDFPGAGQEGRGEVSPFLYLSGTIYLTGFLDLHLYLCHRSLFLSLFFVSYQIRRFNIFTEWLLYSRLCTMLLPHLVAMRTL